MLYTFFFNKYNVHYLIFIQVNVQNYKSNFGHEEFTKGKQPVVPPNRLIGQD